MSNIINGFSRTLILAAAVILSTGDLSQAAPHGGYRGGGYHGVYHGGGYHGGYYHGGGYYGGYHPGGYYRGYGGGYYGGYYPFYGGYWPSFGYGYSRNYSGYSPYYYSGYTPYYGSSIYYDPVYPAPTSTQYFSSPSTVVPANAVQPDKTAHITVQLPNPNAEVTIDGSRTTSTGPVRYYQTPTLDPGRHTYFIQATWMENGQHMSKTRDVEAAPGGESFVNFMPASSE